MKKTLLSLVGLLAAIWSMSSAATSYSTVCNGCTQAQTRQLVQGSRQGDYFVHDMLNRTITHWSIIGTNPDTAKITLIAITPAVQDQFNWVLKFYDGFGTLNYGWDTDVSSAVTQVSVNTLHTANKLITPIVAAGSAPGSPASAFDTINTPVNQNAAIAAATKWSTWGGASMNSVALLASFTSHFTATQVLYPVPVIISQTLHFLDGSTIAIHWDVDANKWVYTTGSAKDAIGNPIPENPDQAVGGQANRRNYVWPATNEGVGAASRASQNFGNIGLRVGVPVFRAGGTWTVACVRVGGITGTVSCTGSPL
jgi:hypothetical protein